jgi:hypothetical protein
MQVGETGVVRIKGRSFWGFRRNRDIPSHLVHGKKRKTRRLTVVGRWEKGGFVLRTVYAGDPAPLEIHDPDIALRQLPESVEFWSTHAIVVSRSEYTLRPPRQSKS